MKNRLYVLTIAFIATYLNLGGMIKRIEETPASYEKKIVLHNNSNDALQLIFVGLIGGGYQQSSIPRIPARFFEISEWHGRSEYTLPPHDIVEFIYRIEAQLPQESIIVKVKNKEEDITQKVLYEIRDPFKRKELGKEYEFHVIVTKQDSALDITTDTKEVGKKSKDVKAKEEPEFGLIPEKRGRIVGRSFKDILRN